MKTNNQLYSLIVLAICMFLIALPIHFGNLAEQGLKEQLKQLSFGDVIISIAIAIGFTTVYGFMGWTEKARYRRIIAQNESSLREKNEMMEVLMRSSAAIIFKVKIDKDFTLLYTSENINEILGYSTEAMYEPQFWLNHLHPEDVPRIFQMMPDIYSTGFGRMQYRFKHNNGNWIWMQAEMKCVYDNGGKPAELLGNWWDITREKELMKVLHVSNERFELAAKATSDVIYDWNLVDNGLWMSDEIFHSYKYPKTSNELSLDWWSEKVHPEDYAELLAAVESTLLQKAETWSGNYRFRKGDGTYAFVFDRAYISYDIAGNPQRWIGSMSDITVVKETETELKQAFLHAEESTKAKSEFLANMSHEIRTPLNGIMGMTELALETDLQPDQRRYLEIVKTSCDMLMNLINDILDFSKIDAGMLELSMTPFSLREDLPQVMQPLGLKASLKQLEFVFSITDDVPDLLIGDAHRIQQIITNLVGNAIKFTETGEIVLHISMKHSVDDKVELLFTVTDTGIGISSDKLETIFHEFIQGDGSTTRKYGGTGLGLSITKRLVELMGGTITAESDEGKGSRFSFTIFLTMQQNQTKLPRFVPLPVLDEKAVLIVEDNQLSKEHLMHMLENFRMKPHGVSTIGEAEQELTRALKAGQPYPLVILDLLLPGNSDGYDVAKFIKTHEKLKDTTVIVVTMSQKASDRERLAQIGIVKYFSKPFSQSDLLDCIQNHLTGTVLPAKRIKMHKPDKAVLSQSGIYHILLVEDNLVNQEVALRMLEKNGHYTTIANNGEEAVQLHKTNDFDLILMDVQMPIMNGYEATAQIRKHERNTGKHTLIIGLTANAMKGDKEKCLEAGMDNYISKPVRMQELFTLLEKVPRRVGEKSNEHPGTTISLVTLMENLEGDISLVKQVLNDFSSSAKRQLEAIEVFVDSGDAKAAGQKAHSLKGQCMLVEMNSVIDLAALIEEYAANNELELIKALLPQLRLRLKDGLSLLKNELETLGK